MNLDQEKYYYDKSIVLLIASFTLVVLAIGLFIRGCNTEPVLTPTVTIDKERERLEAYADSLALLISDTKDTIVLTREVIVYKNQQIKEKQDEVKNLNSDSAYIFFCKYTGSEVISD